MTINSLKEFFFLQHVEYKKCITACTGVKITQFVLPEGIWGMSQESDSMHLTSDLWPRRKWTEADKQGEHWSRCYRRDKSSCYTVSHQLCQADNPSVNQVIQISCEAVRVCWQSQRLQSNCVCVCVCVCVCDKLKQRTFLLCVFNLCQVCPDMSRCVSTPQSFSSVWMTNSLLISAATCLTHYWRSLNVSTQWTTRICQLLRQVGMQLTSVFIIGSFYHHF